MITATDVTVEHYQRPRVRDAIRGYCGNERDSWRALNGDFRHWYGQGAEQGTIRLLNTKDYDSLTAEYRTLYASLDLFDSSLTDKTETWDEEMGRPVNPIGTFEDCIAYTPGVDIDLIKRDLKDPTNIEALQCAAQFFCDYLRDNGILRSVHALFSGGGAYVLTHHALFKAKPEWSREDRREMFGMLCIAYNRLITEIADQFFQFHPEHRGRVKFDAVNNQKRLYKSIFSLHKSLPLAVIPLNTKKIVIDLEKAQLPLSDEVLAEGKRWYQDYDLEEKAPIQELLQKFLDMAKEELKDRRDVQGTDSIYVSAEPIPEDKFPPCISNIIHNIGSGEGKHRALAILAAFLGQAGWNVADALKLWMRTAQQAGIPDRVDIFYAWNRQMVCPTCKKIQVKSAGYPGIGLGGLGYCTPDRRCNEIKWPVSYGMDPSSEYSKEGPNRNYGAQNDEDEQESVATRIVRLVLDSGSELWHTPDGEGFITISINGHKENYGLKSKAAREWIGRIYYKYTDKIPYSQALADAMTVIEGKARFDGPEYPVYVRVADHDGNIYIDLGNDKWEAIRVTQEGWEIVSDPPVHFKRPKGLLALPYPERGGDIGDLRKVINAPSRTTWILIVSWLVQALRPKGPYPILVINGEQGSSKSTLSKFLRAIVDPNVLVLRRPPKSERDLMIAAVNGWVVSYDNLSGLSVGLSDAICVLSTGGGLAPRELYADAEETFLCAQRPVLLNGIDEIATRGDLMDRAIVIDLPRINNKQRKTDRQIVAEFEEIRPGLLGAILDAISTGLPRLPEVELKSLPRMADFAEWIVACEPALPWDEGEFLEAYNRSRDDVLASIVDNDLFASSIYHMVKDTMTEDNPFKGPAALLLETLNTRSNIDLRRQPDGWPRTPKGLSTKLRKIAPALRAMGVGIEFLERTAGERPIMIWSMKSAGQATFSDDDSDDGNDGSDENRHHKNQHQEKQHDGCDGNDGSFHFLSKGGCIKEPRNEIESDHLNFGVFKIKHENNRHNRHNRHDGLEDSDFVDDGSMTVGGISDGNRHSKMEESPVEPPRAEKVESKEERITVWDERIQKIYAKYGGMIPPILAMEIKISEPEAKKVLDRLVEHSGWRCVPTKAGIPNYHPPDPNGPKLGSRKVSASIPGANETDLGQETCG